MDLAYKYAADKRVVVLCPDAYTRKIAESLPEYGNVYKGIYILIDWSIKHTYYGVVIHFSEEPKEFLSVANKIYIPYLDLTQEKLADAISSIEWEWSLFSLPHHCIWWMTIVVLIITENPNIVLWLGEIFQMSGCEYIQGVYGFRVGKIIIRVCNKANAMSLSGLPTHIIYLTDMKVLYNNDAIHYHTLIKSKKELKMLLLRIKWQWE